MTHVGEHRTKPTPHGVSIAYLILGDGAYWHEIHELRPGQVTTIGRAPTNRIVVRDEICSRHHCEIFHTNTAWYVRDLGSRNGTRIDGVPVTGDWELEEGQTIQIGNTRLYFTYDAGRVYPQLANAEVLDGGTATAEGGADQPEIIQRRRRARYASDEVARDRTSRELASLYRMALSMGDARTPEQVADIALQTLIAGTAADIGAVLLHNDPTAPIAPDNLRIVAYRSSGDSEYQRVSASLSEICLKSREAVLARDISSDSRLSERDSLGEILAKSVICAPLRRGSQVLGLIHLYSTNLDNPLDQNDLDYTLAVADHVAIALDSLQERESLARGLQQARDENRTLRSQLQIETDLVGSSPAMQEVRRQISLIAPTDSTVLVRGESGVGKELVSRSIHFNSSRRNGPFVCMNCAALSETLLESELFGHEKGAFTGATNRKLGKFEQADGGTIFLDEVGEMSPAIQSKFLRVLEGHPFERVGGNTPIKVDVRVVAATNRDLEQAVKEKKFRADLYFRLNVVSIHIPPLRERKEDIPELAEHFLQRLLQRIPRPIQGFAPEAMQKLLDYPWPGNVRELQNAIERAVILCRDSLIRPQDLVLVDVSSAEGTGDDGGVPRITIEELERRHILAILDATGWHKSRAARILGIERSTLDRKLKRYGVTRPRR
ncbi:MAG: FHA domain-containing protein [Planctomycetota bacterium]|nr:MAG: FHA domain-containing protein [Planctomycetota bacterium]